MSVADEAVAVRFGAFALDPSTGELTRGGVPVHLAPQPLRVLEFLVRRPGLLVSREEIRDAVWGGGTFVDFEQGLNSCIKQIRAALGDGAESPRFVETVPKRGYRFIAEVRHAEAARAEAAPALPRRPSRGLVLAGVALALAVGAALLRLRFAAVPSSDRPSRVAVLPFANLSGDAAREFFADGLTEEMISALGRLEIGVIARTSAMHYKGTRKSVAEIARELRVEYVLEGSVRESAGRVRITAQLVEAREQQRLWGDVYERAARDVLALQGEVAEAVAREIRRELSVEQREPLARARSVDPEAYADYLRGRHAWSRRSEAGMREAIAHFGAAIERDPTWAPAHAGLADAWSLMSLYAGVPPLESFPKARAAARRALELDPRLAEAHTSVAYVAHRFDWDWATAEAHYARALELNPSYATALHWHAELLIVLGRMDDARRELQRAYELDPLSPRILLDLGLPDYFEGRWDAAVGGAGRALALEPGFLPAHLSRRAAQELAGRFPEAIASLRRAERAGGLASGSAAARERALNAAGPKGYWTLRVARAEAGEPPTETPAHVANLHAASGDVGRALDWLERALEQRDDELVWVAVEPACVPLRGEPRFAELLRKMGLGAIAAEQERAAR